MVEHGSDQSGRGCFCLETTGFRPHTEAATGTQGEVAEWSIASVLKTEDGKLSVGSNPTLSASFSQLVWTQRATREEK